MKYNEVMVKLKSLSSREAVAGMARYGINPKNNYGVSVTALRTIAKEIGIDHELAQQLWSSGIHDARILATIVDDPKQVTEGQMEKWVKDFDSWDLCDQACMNLFALTPVAYQKAEEWSKRSEEFVKRAGFTLMARLAVGDKKQDNGTFVRFLSLIESGAMDERNYVRKSVNWALRQIGKRNLDLNEKAIEAANRIHKLDSKLAKWIASNAIRELKGEKVRDRLNRQNARTRRKKEE
jgi:3-methyladenine DNA glycosylase AlkD